MAKLKGALHSDEAGGQFAGSIIYRRGKGGAVATKYYKPGSALKFLASEAQLARRASYALGMSLWNSLPSEEKEFWNLLEKNGSVIV